MSKTNILRVRRSDATDSHLLVHITHQGPKPLDLKLIGTEHTELFHGQIKDSQSKSLQASNYGGTLREWNAILRYALLGERDSSEDTTENTSNTTKNKTKSKETHSEKDPDGAGDDEEILNNLDIAASIKSQTLTLTLRKNLPGGIVQRLGSIELSEDTNREAISPFDWVDEAVAHSDSLKIRLDAQRNELVAARAETEKLNSRLDELVKAKKEFERDLLEKCAALINAKKLKIRDQQRLLMGAKVEEGVAREVTRGRGGKGKIKREEDGREAGAGKRRKVEVKEEIVDDDEGNETEGDDADGQQEETPPPSVGDAAEDSEDEGFAAAPPARTVKESDAAASTSGTSQTRPASDKMDVDETEELPPKRELPFGRTSGKATAASASAVSATKNAEDDYQDDDDTDDEL